MRKTASEPLMSEMEIFLTAEEVKIRKKERTRILRIGSKSPGDFYNAVIELCQMVNELTDGDQAVLDQLIHLMVEGKLGSSDGRSRDLQIAYNLL
jgi:hypothetical protein